MESLISRACCALLLMRLHCANRQYDGTDDEAPTATTRIAMWSGPRNLSTALMRSFENRADCSVLDEPLYAAYLAPPGSTTPAATT